LNATNRTVSAKLDKFSTYALTYRFEQYSSGDNSGSDVSSISGYKFTKTGIE